MNYDLSAALNSLRPLAEWVLRGNKYSGLEWLDENQTQPTEEEIVQKIAELDNVILTPHIGAQTKEAQSLAANVIAEKIVQILRGVI